MSFKVLKDCAVVPFVVRQAFGVTASDNQPERMLWRDVAARLTLDAYGITGMSKKDKSEYRELLIAIAEAQAWFRHDHDGMEYVFELANVELEPVRRAVLEFISRDIHRGPKP